jgi:hypothetical protein
MSASTRVLGTATAGRTRPTRTPDGVDAVNRCTPYGELMVRKTDRYTRSVEGSEYVANNATPGTAITMQASVTAYAATTPSLIVTNLSAATDGKVLELEYIRILALTVPGGSGLQRFDARVDSIARYSSGGTTITPVNTYIGSDNSTLSRVYVGALTAAAASSGERLIAAGIARNGVGLAGDYFHFDFTGEQVGNNFLNPATTAGLTTVIPMPEVPLTSGSSFLLNWWGASLSTAATWEFNIKFRER